MKKTAIHITFLFVLLGGTLSALSPQLQYGDAASDARRDADRRRRQQEATRKDEERRRIRNEEEKNQEQRLNPDRIFITSLE